MRQVLFVIALVVIILTFSCSKDDYYTPTISEEPGIVTLDGSTMDGLRIGEGDLIFFRNSLTTDNYLVATNNVGRSHRAYNASTIAYIQFDLGLNTVFNIYGAELASNGSIIYKITKYKHYKALIQFKDSLIAPEKLTVYTKDTVNHFKIYPTGGYVKITSPSTRWIEWRRDSFATFILNNELRGTRYSGWVWDIYRNEEFFEQKPKEPINILSNQFQPDHRN